MNKDAILKQVTSMLSDPSVEVEFRHGTKETTKPEASYRTYERTQGAELTIKVRGGAVDVRDPLLS